MLPEWTTKEERNASFELIKRYFSGANNTVSICMSCVFVLFIYSVVSSSQTNESIRAALLLRHKYNILWNKSLDEVSPRKSEIGFITDERIASYCSYDNSKCYVYLRGQGLALGRELLELDCSPRSHPCASGTLEVAAKFAFDLALHGDATHFPRYFSSQEQRTNSQPPEQIIEQKAVISTQQSDRDDMQSTSLVGRISSQTQERRYESGILFTESLSWSMIKTEYINERPKTLLELVDWVSKSLALQDGSYKVKIACYKSSDPVVWIFVDDGKGKPFVGSVLYVDETKEWFLADRIFKNEEKSRFDEVHSLISEILCWQAEN